MSDLLNSLSVKIEGDEGQDFVMSLDDLKVALGIEALEKENKRLTALMLDFLSYANEVDTRLQAYNGEPVVTQELQMHIRDGRLALETRLPQPPGRVVNDSLARLQQMASKDKPHPALEFLNA